MCSCDLKPNKQYCIIPVVLRFLHLSIFIFNFEEQFPKHLSCITYKIKHFTFLFKSNKKLFQTQTINLYYANYFKNYKVCPLKSIFYFKLLSRQTIFHIRRFTYKAFIKLYGSELYISGISWIIYLMSSDIRNVKIVYTKIYKKIINQK